MKISFVLLALIAIEITLSLQADQFQWKSRAIYQIITDRFALGNGTQPACNLAANTYCGGNFKGIQNNIPYIKGMGFDAIWISPIVVNYPNDFHGYAAKNIYEINPYFGTVTDFYNLITACKQNNIYLMVDVVANHMGNLDQDYSQNVPFNQASYYHPWCVISQECFNDKDMTCIQTCRLASLADLDQDNTYVRSTLLQWIKDLVKNYTIDGLRIDTVPEVKPDFWTQFNTAAGVFQLGEIEDGDFSYVGQYVGPLTSVLNYPFFYTMRNIWINQQSMSSIRTYYSNWFNVLGDISALGSFIDNHDNPRFLSSQACTASHSSSVCLVYYKNMITFTLTSYGIPIIYYGTEQQFNGNNDPYNREPLWGHMDTSAPLYQLISIINKYTRKFKLNLYDQVESYVDDNLYAYFRGQVWVGVTNKQGQDVTATIGYHPFQDGDVICNIFNTADCLTLSDSQFTVVLNQGTPKVYIEQSQLITEEQQQVVDH